MKGEPSVCSFCGMLGHSASRCPEEPSPLDVRASVRAMRRTFDPSRAKIGNGNSARRFDADGAA